MSHPGAGCWWERLSSGGGAGDIWHFPVLSAQFFCKAKTALKIKFMIEQTNKEPGSYVHTSEIVPNSQVDRQEAESYSHVWKMYFRFPLRARV